MSDFLQIVWDDLTRLFTVPLLTIAKQPISLLWLLNLSLVLVVVVLGTRASNRFLKHRLLGQLGIAVGSQEAIATLCSYGIGALGFILVLDASGLNLASLSLLAGGLGVGIGIGLQDFAKNLISGVALLLEGKLQSGDYIEVDERISGYIKEISTRATVVRTRDGIDAIVPNNDLTSNRILNWSYLNLRGRLRIPVSVSSQSDPLRVTELLLQAAYMEAAVIHDPAPRVLFKGFGDERFDFELVVWVDQVDLSEFITSSLYYLIEQNLRERDISLPTSSKLDVRISEKATAPLAISPSSLAEETSVARTDLIDLLKQVKFFQDSADAQLQHWLSLGYRRDFAAGEIVYREGDRSQKLYIVLKGAIEGFLEEGHKRYNIYQSGNFFGDLSLWLNTPTFLSMQALEDSTLFVINQSSFNLLIHKRPAFAERFLHALDHSHQMLEAKKKELQEMGAAIGINDEQSLKTWMQSRLRDMLKR